MEITRCPLCFSKIEKKHDTYKCPVCGVSFKKTLDTKITLFGLTRKPLEHLDKNKYIIQRLGKTYIVIPLRGGRVFRATTYEYYVSLVKKLSGTGIEWICAEASKKPRLTPLFSETQKYPRILRVGTRVKKAYRLFDLAYVLINRKTRVCTNKFKRYKRFFGILLVLFSPL